MPSSSMTCMVRLHCSWVGFRFISAGTPRVPNRPPHTISRAGRCTETWSCMVALTTPKYRRISTKEGRGFPMNRTGGLSLYRGRTSLVSSLMKVDFPAPFGPSSAMCSPWLSTKSSTLSISLPSRLTRASWMANRGVELKGSESWDMGPGDTEVDSICPTTVYSALSSAGT